LGLQIPSIAFSLEPLTSTLPVFVSRLCSARSLANGRAVVFLCCLSLLLQSAVHPDLLSKTRDERSPARPPPTSSYTDTAQSLPTTTTTNNDDRDACFHQLDRAFPSLFRTWTEAD
jgi:hypothetical protein